MDTEFEIADYKFFRTLWATLVVNEGVGYSDILRRPCARSRAEITAAAQARRIPIGPVLSPAELLADRQYAARHFLAGDGTPRLPLLVDGARPDWRRQADKELPADA